MAGDFDSQVAGVAILNDPVRRSLYQFVAGAPSPVSRDEAAAAVGIQRPLAAFHLDKLAAAGLLEVEFRRLTGRTGPGAGRPAKLYRRGDRQLDVTVPPREYDVAAHLLAAAIDRAARAGGDVRRSLEEVAFDFGRRLGAAAEERAGRRPSMARRWDALAAVLREHGFEPRREGGELVLGNCPFHRLALEYTDLVCGMNLHLMQGVRSALPLRVGVLQPRLEPSANACCVRFGSAA